MDNYSQILKTAYEQFLLNIGGKKVPTPYRINLPYQSDRRKYGKSDPETLIKDTEDIAREQNFDLDKASVEEIKKFMQENMLGIDCSGLTYHVLNSFLKKIGQGGMANLGFPPASKTNVETLTSEKFASKLAGLKEARPGDIIRIGSKSPDLIQHCMVVIETNWGMVTYTHSSRRTRVKGVHTDTISLGKFPTELNVYSYDPAECPDGLWRLNGLI